MTLSIRQTITSALNDDHGIDTRQYAEYIDTVEKALLEREYALVEAAIDTADDQYGYGNQAKALLAETGFEFKPEPQPEPEVEAEPAAEVDSDAPVTQGEFAVLVNSVDALAKSVQALVNAKASDVF